MKAVLDTNIFISDIFWEGSSNKVILNWKEGKFTLVTSLEAVSEIIKVLKDFKIGLSDDMIKEWDIEDMKEKLEIVDTFGHFWFAWAAFFPESNW